MKLNISYETTYFFSSNVPRLVQSVMLHPTECTNQKVISCDIATSKGELIEVPKDALGHKLYNIYNKNISEPQTISMNSAVETKNHFGVMKGLNESVHPHCFLRQTKLTNPDKKMLNNLCPSASFGTSINSPFEVAISQLITFWLVHSVG